VVASPRPPSDTELEAHDNHPEDDVDADAGVLCGLENGSSVVLPRDGIVVDVDGTGEGVKVVVVAVLSSSVGNFGVVDVIVSLDVLVSSPILTLSDEVVGEVVVELAEESCMAPLLCQWNGICEW